MTCALNAANEKANELFREGKYDFFGIPKVRCHPHEDAMLRSRKLLPMSSSIFSYIHPL